ncbi:flagellar hook-length control protein FliK [Rhizobium halophilum]|uniref:flagellar hook-length control protein FliK n=1 Tax=Rhizobium halophilum TaxID=2846852 RepID=UPI001EFC5610|nr:flagellar hook-length control protein FliK [Rhizobium halophilum]MCF6369557.1 flagellar hook-length control protein FliK [Rhizobium halophilum]
MTLEVLAKPAPKEAPSKPGGRAAARSEAQSEGEAFSSALSKAKRGVTSGDTVGRADRSTSPAPAEDAERAVKDGARLPGSRLKSGEDPLVKEEDPETGGAAHTTPSPEKSITHRRASAIEPSTDEVQRPVIAAATEETPEGGEEEAAAPQNAAELLTILVTPSAAVATGAGARAANPAEGRKASDPAPERAAKSISGADIPKASADAIDMPSSEGPDNSVDRSFRFINAKSGAVNSELTTAAQSQDLRAPDTKAAMPQAENVIVLDSRRFIGFQTGANSASLMAAMVGDQAWTAAMQADASLSNIATQSSSGSVVHMLKLQMTPHDLGTVTATLKMNGEQLHVQLTVETRAAHRQLSEDSSGMLDALRSQGFTVDQVTISIAPSAESDPQKGQQGAQSGQQQAMGHGEREGTNRNQTGERSVGVADDRNGDDDAALDNAPAVGAGGAGSTGDGQLYL